MLSSSGELNDYLNRIARYPILSRDAQLIHARHIQAWLKWPDGKTAAPLRIRRRGQRSFDALVRTNLRLVVSVAKKYQNRGLDMPDLIQEGNCGLCRGVELYDPTRGYSLSTYTYWWIRQAITRALYTSGRTIRLPINNQELLARIKRFISTHEATEGSTPTLSAISTALDLPPERVEHILFSDFITRCNSLDRACQEDSATDFLAFVADPASTEESETTWGHLEIDDIWHFVDTLSARDADIIRGVYIEGLTLAEVGRRNRLSRERIRQLCSKALNQLRINFYMSNGQLPESETA